jgi:hypothetical protein
MNAVKSGSVWIADMLMLVAVLALFLAFSATCVGRRFARRADRLWLSAKGWCLLIIRGTT